MGGQSRGAHSNLTRAGLVALALALVVCAGGLRADLPTRAGGGVAQGPPRRPGGVESRIRRVEEGLLPPVVIKGRPAARARLADRMRFYKTPAVSVAVISGGEVEWARGYGVKSAGGDDRADADTLFQAASVSKPVAAVAALRLVQEGRLSLDEDVNTRLVSWKVPENEFTREKKVTLRGLLSHSAGLTVHGFTGYATDAALPTAVQILEGAPPANSDPVRVDVPPGSTMRYSGGGYTAVQQLLVDVTGKPFPELMDELVLRKLGMKDSTFRQPLPEPLRARAASGHYSGGEEVKGRWRVYPTMAAGGLWTTAADLARFAVEVQKSAAGKSNKILSREMTRLMLTPQLANWGLGPTLQGAGRSARFSHGGANAGYRAFAVAFTETGQGAVVLTNSDNGETLIDEILRSVAAEYDWPDYRPVEKSLATVDPRLLETFAGLYQLGPGRYLNVTTAGGKLYGRLTGNPVEEMHPESDTRYFLMVPGVPELSFVRDAKGNVTGIELLIEGRHVTLPRMTLPAPSLSGNTTFRLAGREAARIVAVAGSFNDWNPSEKICAREGGAWVCRFDLPPGKHAYKFIVDGEWLVDPDNPRAEYDSAGNKNSVVVVAPR